MSVSIHFSGRLGNNLIQYSFGRIVAEHYGYGVTIKDHNHVKEFPNVVDTNDFKVWERPVEYNDTVDPNIGFEEIFADTTHRNIILKGYWQKSKFYIDHRDKVKEWCWLPESTRSGIVHPDDVILHIRREDYIQARSDLNFSYYDKAIAELNPRRIFIIGVGIDNVVKNHFARYNPIYAQSTEVEDFKFMKCFRRVVMSNSTFCWMATFVSDKAEVIYYPRPVSGYWNPNSEQQLYILGFHKLVENITIGN